EFELEVLTPVHIGTGDALDPTEYYACGYTAAGGRRIGCVSIYDQHAAILALRGDFRERLDGLLSGDRPDPVEIRKFFSGTYEAAESENGGEGRCGGMESCLLRAVAAQHDIVAAYREDIGNRKSDLRIYPTLCVANGRGAPLIPGSTIKGALRTAWLNGLERRTKALSAARARCEDRKKQEREVMGSPNEDPFRLLAVGDVEMPDKALFVGRVRNVRKGGWTDEGTGGAGRRDAGGASNIRIFCEFVGAAKDAASGGGGSAAGAGRIALASDGRKRGILFAGASDGKRHVRVREEAAPPDLDAILAAAREDARRELERERQFSGKGCAAGEKAAELEARLKEIESKGERAALIKIGRFCGVWSKTLEGLREPKGRIIGGQPRWGMTRNVVPEGPLPGARQVFPGWCLLRLK
ncbi:MAG: RAMP superfamily CRISPR-associated protein, partial [Planctomycetota bacterium]|nr:RAMP superfamily CRISPR-associated protein [Planctomycetota bacterium]